MVFPDFTASSCVQADGDRSHQNVRVNSARAITFRCQNQRVSGRCCYGFKRPNGRQPPALLMDRMNAAKRSVCSEIGKANVGRTAAYMTQGDAKKGCRINAFAEGLELK